MTIIRVGSPFVLKQETKRTKTPPSLFVSVGASRRGCSGSRLTGSVVVFSCPLRAFPFLSRSSPFCLSPPAQPYGGGHQCCDRILEASLGGFGRAGPYPDCRSSKLDTMSSILYCFLSGEKLHICARSSIIVHKRAQLCTSGHICTDQGRALIA